MPQPRHYWLIKSEPDCYSIDDFKREKKAAWTGIRNYQARNFMKAMRVGDLAVFYHSSANPPAAAGIARVTKEAYPDSTAFDKKSEYYEPKATKEKPIWEMVDFAFVEKFKTPVPLPQIKNDPHFDGLMLAAPAGSRLSVQPVSEKHFNRITQLGKKLN